MIIIFSQSQALSPQHCYGDEIVVGVSLLGYHRKHVTCCLREFPYKVFTSKYFSIWRISQDQLIDIDKQDLKLQPRALAVASQNIM